MSEEFEVPSPHEHEVEHRAQHDPFAGRIAVMTAIFATIGALFGYMAGATQNEALLFKNEAAIRKTEASDQWNFYQAKSSKQNLAELGATLATGDQQARYVKEVERYKKEKEEIMPEAKKLEQQSARKTKNQNCRRAAPSIGGRHAALSSRAFAGRAAAGRSARGIDFLSQRRTLREGATESYQERSNYRVQRA